MHRPNYLVALLLACALDGCASSPASVAPPAMHRFDLAKDPYWENPQWLATLVNSIQSALHAPGDPADMSTPGYHGTIRFQFQDGIVEYPEIVTSTGNPSLDKLMVDQAASVQVPKPTGPHADEPHDFELELEMPTPFESFENRLYSAINYWKVYPKDPIIAGAAGNSTVDFDYLDGKASNIILKVSSKNKDLDGSSLSAVTKASYAPAPAAYAGKTLHMEVIFCYTIEMNGGYILNPCPTSDNVIHVTATRTVTVTNYRVF